MSFFLSFLTNQLKYEKLELRRQRFTEVQKVASVTDKFAVELIRCSGTDIIYNMEPEVYKNTVKAGEVVLTREV